MTRSRQMFSALVTLGNDAMQSPQDVAAALRQLAEGLDTWQNWPADLIIEGRVKDANGNGVGTWECI